MATIKSYSDLQQSRKLAEILPLKSADYCWGIDDETLCYNNSPYPCPWKDYSCKEYYIPCWSLAALLDILESEIDGEEGETYQLNIEKFGPWWNVWYKEQYDEANPIEIEPTEELIDACYELILKLHELKML